MKNLYFYIFSFTIFLVNPFLGILLVLSIVYLQNKNSKKIFVFISILLSVFLSLINLTKVPENDLLFHSNNYFLAENMSLIEYLSHFGKEPVAFIFNYAVYHLSGGSMTCWIFIFTCISYSIFFMAVIIFFQKINATGSQTLLGLVLAAFFPQLFSLSAHLIRQFAAGAIFMYFAVDKIICRNNKWWLMFLGIFVHSSSLLLFPLVYCVFLGDFRKKKFLNISIILVLIFYQSVAKFFLKLLDDMHPVITYVLTRASTDTSFDLGEFQFLNYVMMFFMVCIVTLYLTKKIKFYHKLSQVYNYRYIKKFSCKFKNFYIANYFLNKKINFYDEKMVHFFSIMFFLVLFVLINIHQSELSNRLFFYVFFFFPFVAPLIFGRKILLNKLLAGLCSVAMIVFFLYRLPNGTWTYAPLSEIAMNSLFSYL